MDTPPSSFSQGAGPPGLHSSRWAPTSSQSLTKQIVVASVVSIVALAIVCGLGLSSLRRLSLQNDAEMAQRLALLDESEVFQLLLYQKGFAVDFMFTGDERWLHELDQGRREFADWLTQADRTADTTEERRLLERIRRDYRQLDEEHTAMIASFRRGADQEVRLQHQRIYTQLNDLVRLSEEFVRTSSVQARYERAVAQRTLRRDTALLLSSSLLGMVTSLLVGFLVARRVARPIYELQLQVASAAQRIRIEVPPGRAGFEALGEHMGAILRKIEETDAAIAEQRRLLIQSEKMSAIGEVSAKLAHEILNPLTGIKAAVQLVARSQLQHPDDSPTAKALSDTAQLVSQEIARVEQLIRRMLTYARPLAPRLALCSVDSLLSMSIEASRQACAQAEVRIDQREPPSLPRVMVDRALLVQALSNLLVNAAQASPPGGTVVLEPSIRPYEGKPMLALRVLDEGHGIADSVAPHLFQPFFTTKPRGNGLGLALSQNIAREHGGIILAQNRSGQRGAEFTLLLPLQDAVGSTQARPESDSTERA
jgi:signal transduction histidine kinase